MADIERISVEEARRKVLAGDAMLVCGYDEDAKYRPINLAGSIPLSRFESELGALPKAQEIILYCAWGWGADGEIERRDGRGADEPFGAEDDRRGSRLVDVGRHLRTDLPQPASRQIAHSSVLLRAPLRTSRPPCVNLPRRRRTGV